MFTKSGSIQTYKEQRLLLIPIIAFIPIAGWLADVWCTAIFCLSGIIIIIDVNIERVYPTVTGITSTACSCVRCDMELVHAQ